MTRCIADLESNAAKFWPTALVEKEQTTSIIPKLIETQEKFIAVLYTADSSPTVWKEALAITTNLPSNLFVKHLMVLSDVSGESLRGYHKELLTFFPKGIMTFRWKDAEHTYQFRSIAGKQWSNDTLYVNGAGLVATIPLTDAMEDVVMLLLHGGSAIDPGLPDDLTEKCCIGAMIGDREELDTFVRQRYIHVSRITGGASANTMGQLCQQYVRERLQARLPKWDLSKPTIPGISQTGGRTDMSFDLVAESPAKRFCAIEVSFQVTTNSTIERKAGQAAARQATLHAAGHKIAYVIDGAGNFHRRSALATICAHSDCTVSFTDKEIDILVSFLKSM